jgi:hypothetical protein
MKSLTLLTLLFMLLCVPPIQAADGTREGAVPNISVSGQQPGTIIRETDETYTITPFESVSLNQTQTWQDNRLRAYFDTNIRHLNGFLLFDVTQIPDDDEIVSMTLRCYLENAFGSPYLNPVVDVYYSGDDNWTRMSAVPGSLSLDVLLADNVPFNSYVNSYDFTLNVGAHNWAEDLQDNRICLALKNDVNYYSYVYFYGAYGSPTGPPPQLIINTLSPVPPNLDITMAPVNPPIVIPAQGGSFQFTISIENNGPGQVPFYVWSRIRYPNGQYFPPAGYVVINPPVGVLLSRLKTQNVPSTWMSGIYTYTGFANISYSYPALDSSAFTFEKSVTASGAQACWEASCNGEPFPGETLTSAYTSGSRTTPTTMISPNPFNLTTAISYELRASCLVSLKVYDTAGRQVTTLVDGWREAGTHEVKFDGSSLASGIYLYTLQAGGQTLTEKMLLIK